jgi:hypothetical protein
MCHLSESRFQMSRPMHNPGIGPSKVSRTCRGDGSSSKQQQLAGAEWSIAPHAASPDRAGLTLWPDPARAN